MKFADAPPAGWYPDPQNRTRLRWWDGLDWTDIRRAPPSDAELASFEAMQEEMRQQAVAASGQIPTGVPQMPQGADTQQVISQVRSAARSEIDRAADVFSQRARQATREIEPLISKYTAPAVRWIRIAAILAVILLVVYFLFQVFAQASILDWIGDRIDNLTDENSIGVVVDEPPH
ncbi:MAG: DUF2510 domain-containing protein [Actinomycetota bacterium]